jgi:succinoglycan biosynthesis protein ExoV
MKLFYYRGSTANFGDDLNDWIWPQLLPGFFDGDERTLFLGIGSIIFNSFPATARKIVFGSGYAGYTAKPAVDEQWDFRFVRGELTAQALGLPLSKAIGDAAILVRSCPIERTIPTYDLAFMPHWESAVYGDWPEVALRAGMHYIDPRWPVERVLKDLLASRILVSEAMHGAIVADALRVPWIPVRPLSSRHRSKWYDWSSALGLELPFVGAGPSNAYEWTLACVDQSRTAVRHVRKRATFLRKIVPEVLQERAARRLVALSNSAPLLSSDAAIDRAHSRMMEQLDALKTNAS